MQPILTIPIDTKSSPIDFRIPKIEGGIIHVFYKKVKENKKLVLLFNKA